MPDPVRPTFFQIFFSCPRRHLRSLAPHHNHSCARNRRRRGVLVERLIARAAVPRCRASELNTRGFVHPGSVLMWSVGIDPPLRATPLSGQGASVCALVAITHRGTMPAHTDALQSVRQPCPAACASAPKPRLLRPACDRRTFGRPHRTRGQKAQTTAMTQATTKRVSHKVSPGSALFARPPRASASPQRKDEFDLPGGLLQSTRNIHGRISRIAELVHLLMHGVTDQRFSDHRSLPRLAFHQFSCRRRHRLLQHADLLFRPRDEIFKS